MAGSALKRLAGITLLTFFIFGCRGEQSISLPEIRAFTNRAEWAVIQTGYVRVHRHPDAGSVIAGHLRRGDVVSVIRESAFTDEVDGVFRRWYQVAGDVLDGWVFGGYVELFDSAERAQSGSEAIPR